jgi:hypothetical protein
MVVVVGADSMVTRGVETTSHESLCKIIQVDSFFYAFSGVIEDPDSEFSVAAMVERAAERGRTILEVANAFEAITLQPLSAFLSRMRQKHPEFFLRKYEDQSPVQAVFVGFDHHVPVMYLRSFKVRSATSGEILLSPLRRDCPGDDCETGIANAFLGQHEAIDRFIADNPSIWKIGLVDAVRKLIEMEIENDPAHVGPPIDILRLDRNGAQWIQKKSECPEITPVGNCRKPTQ